MQGDWPTYEELVEMPGCPQGASWGVFGKGDELGTINFLDSRRVLEATSLVSRGAVFNLDYPINAFDPYPTGTRPAAEHVIFGTNPNHRDDYINSFYLQSTSQVDGLRHMRHPRHGFYGGTSDDEIKPGTSALGIHRWADHGIVGRGVLLDVARFFEDSGRDIDTGDGASISVGDLEMVAKAEQVTFRDGDILLLRTGWAARRLHNGGQSAPLVSPGLEQTKAMVAWLWDHHFAMVAADNLAVEVLPVRKESDFRFEEEPVPSRGMDHNGMIHRPLISLLGMALGEMWNLEDLAGDCRRDHVYECMVVCKPLNLVGGVGSPANAIAIK